MTSLKKRCEGCGKGIKGKPVIYDYYYYCNNNNGACVGKHPVRSGNEVEILL